MTSEKKNALIIIILIIGFSVCVCAQEKPVMEAFMKFITDDDKTKEQDTILSKNIITKDVIINHFGINPLFCIEIIKKTNLDFFEIKQNFIYISELSSYKTNLVPTKYIEIEKKEIAEKANDSIDILIKNIAENKNSTQEFNINDRYFLISFFHNENFYINIYNTQDFENWDNVDSHYGYLFFKESQPIAFFIYERFIKNR